MRTLFFIVILLGIQFSSLFAQNTNSGNVTIKKESSEIPAEDLDSAATGMTEQEADDLAIKNEKSKGDTIQSYKIIVEDLSYLTVCPGTNITIPFKTIGPFDTDNTFMAYLIDASGKAVGMSLPFKKGPIKAVIPAYKKGGEVYRIQVVSTIPIIKSNEAPIRLLEAPHADILATDNTRSVRIMPGQEAALKVNLTGTAPWTFRLSDSTTVTQTLSNPHYLIVKPAQTKAFQITGVSNYCGSGVGTGETIVNVDNNPEPKLQLKDSDKFANVCTGIPFQVPVSATGKYKDGNRFVVQLADKSGVFKTISTPDSTGNLVTQIPNSYPPGAYKLRVASSAPVLYTQAVNVSIMAPTVTTLMKDSLHLEENQTGELTVKFQGGGPWFVLLSDGTYENNIMESPHKLKVKPLYNTNFQISSAGGLCGVGKFSGTAKVTVKSPPVAINIDRLPQNVACIGSTISIPYKTSGRFNVANKFVVQITDKSGRFIDLPTTVTPTAMQVKLIGSFENDTIQTQKLRIISSSPAVSSTQQEIDIIAPDKAIGEVSGKGFITAGRSTRIQLKFKNGMPPWSFTLSDGTSISGTFLNPYLISVSPEKTTDFTIKTLKSGCGQGTGKGSAHITVEN